MSNQTTEIQKTNREKNRIALLSVLINVMLMVSKLTIGLIIGSVSVISEGIHSSIDMVAALFAFIGVRQSAKPPDTDHYYGHGKYENVSGAVQAILILAASVLIIWESYLKIVNGVEVEDVNLGIAIMVVSCIANYFISDRMLKVAKKTESIALEADAWHHRTDVLTSLGILLGLVIIRFTGIKILDPIMAIIVAIFILRTAITLVLRSARDLIDVRLPAAEENRIKSIIQKYAGNYLEFHEMRTRKAGSDRFIDFHLVVCQDTSIEIAHHLADKMEEEIIHEFPRARVIIHIEPCGKLKECAECDKTPILPKEG